MNNEHDDLYLVRSPPTRARTAGAALVCGSVMVTLHHSFVAGLYACHCDIVFRFRPGHGL